MEKETSVKDPGDKSDRKGQLKAEEEREEARDEPVLTTRKR
jgi:hypothetical protein